jgi:tetratricopeptide (TPR) repeat protein
MLLMMLALGLLSACSGQRAGTRAKAASEIVVPAGVDTAIARQADSLSKALTVDLKAERQATELRRKGRSLVAASDSLWSMIESRQTVSQADSLAAIEEFNRAALALKEAAALQRGAKRSRGDEALQQRVLKYLQEARRYLEKAVLLNPFDLESRSWLARVYQSLATRFERRDDQRKAVEILENLVRLEKGEHVLFRRLGEAYYALGFWQEAYENFAEAARVLRQTAFEAVRDDDISRESLRQAPVDTSALFYYVYYQGDTKAKQYDTERALSYFRSALTLAPTAADSQSVAAYIDWIEWDAGNIRAAEKRDSLLRLLSKGRYEEAAKGFKALLGKLRSAEAKDEIEWRLAVLEYQRLNQKPSAVERLARVVKRQARGTSGTGAENEQRRYTEAYGTMCYNLGLENLTKNRQTAFAYFLQAAATPWSGRAKSYLEIAKLSQNNPEAVIDNALAALKEASGLESEEVGQLYRLLTAAYKRTGRFDEAREYYYKWLTLKER